MYLRYLELWTVFVESHKLLYVVSIFLCLKISLYSYFYFFLDPLVIQEYVVSFLHICPFSIFLLLLIFRFIPLYENMLDIISILLKFFRTCFVDWHIGSILESFLCSLEKNVYSTVAVWNVLYTSVRSILSIILFKFTVSLLIFCLDDLPFVDSGY